MIQQALDNQETFMTLAVNLQQAVTALTTQVTALTTENGVIEAAFNDLLAKAQSQGGSVSDTDVQSALAAVQSQTAAIQAQIAQVDAAVKSADPGPSPAAPTPAPVSTT